MMMHHHHHQITEDTPPDMLAGAMDLTVHLPCGRAVKMSVERSTPMMDLLVQITTAHHLQLSSHVIQALGMAPSSEYSDKILPYKPSTPIGALDTQHIKVLPKGRTLPVQKNVHPGHQPFESTFRLKVHLPRNQLYVIRVSQNVFIENIMKKVCEEKNLDPMKYECRHPGSLDEVLDPKLTLSDYQITEIYIVTKGTIGLTQAYPTTDIMALRKEEERKQLHNKTGSSVFNLIFKKGKTSMGSGSLSSENRSISPTQSDESRSVTPPAIQQKIITPIQQKAVPPAEKPKAPQRKRRPAPKPPTLIENQKNAAPEPVERPASNVSSICSETNCDTTAKKVENGLTICHSRNSSDSSGYHEASILSDHCNTSLPRKPKTAVIPDHIGRSIGEHSRSTGNLSKMSLHSKSMSSLHLPGRKKKAAPPPPPVLKGSTSVTNLDSASPIVSASHPQTTTQFPEKPLTPRSSIEPENVPHVLPRKMVMAPIPKPRRSKDKEVTSSQPNEEDQISDKPPLEKQVSILSESSLNLNETINMLVETNILQESESLRSSFSSDIDSQEKRLSNKSNSSTRPAIVGVIPKPTYNKSGFDTLSRKRGFRIGSSMISQNTDSDMISLKSSEGEWDSKSLTDISLQDRDSDYRDDLSLDGIDESMFNKPSKKFNRNKKTNHSNKSDELRGMHNFERKPSQNSIQSDISNIDSFPGLRKKWRNNEDLDLLSTSSEISYLNQSVVGDTTESESASNIVIEETSRRSSTTSTATSQSTTTADSKKVEDILPKPVEEVKYQQSIGKELLAPVQEVITNIETEKKEPVPLEQEAPIQKAEIKLSPKEETILTPDIDQEHQSEVDSGVCLTINSSKYDSKDEDNELETEWQYQLPSPPTAFRDSSPTNLTNYETVTLEGFNATDSVVTSPELFEKLKQVKEVRSEKETVSDLTSVASEEDKEILNKLSLENLEKRKSLVYNRELSTSLKFAQEETVNSNNKQESISVKRSSVLSELEGVISSTGKQNTISRHNSRATEKVVFQAPVDSALPNFKITTYDKPKEKINIFEDDTIRSNSDTAKRQSFAEQKRESITEIQKNIIGEPTRNSVDAAPTTLKRNSVTGSSMENISYRRTSFESAKEETVFKKPPEYGKYKPKTSIYTKNQDVTSVGRSGSFSMNFANSSWTPSVPVKRSKSQVALNKYENEQKQNSTESDGLTKSNSLYDVSGLQSLEVIRKIQTSLRTPNGSVEHLERKAPTETKPFLPEDNKSKTLEKTTETTTSVRTHHFRGPPSINLGTWSERPKTQVNLKEDSDYKFNKKEKDNINSKLIVNTTNNNITSNNTIEVKNNDSFARNDYSRNYSSSGVSVKVNGTEQISSAHPGKVFIKIGNGETRPRETEEFSNRFISHTTASGFRKPLGNINKIESKPQRPHSIAFDTDYQPPVVRSVEYKKPFIDLQSNKSVTQINPSNNFYESNSYNGNEPKTEERRNSQVYLSSEITNNKPINKFISIAQKVPTVKGFRNFEASNNTINNRMSWNGVSSYNTLPAKTTLQNKKEESYGINNNVPFSQSNLKRTDSNKVIHNGSNGSANILGNVVLRSVQNSQNNTPTTTRNQYEVPNAPKPPPPMKNFITPTRFEPKADPRSELLSAIRNFGGKKGLKSAK